MNPSLTRSRPGPFRSPDPTLGSFWVILFLFVACLAFFTPFFYVNDDLWTLFITQGIGISTSGDEHVFFNHILIGLCLKFLYANFPKTPWFAGLLVLSQFLAAWALLLAFQLGSRDKWKTILFVAAFLEVGMYFLLRLNYTMTSALLFQGGAFLLHAIHEGVSPSRRKPPLLLSASCFLLSYLWRPEVSLLFAALTAPFLLRLFMKNRSKVELRSFALALFSTIAILAWMDVSSYRHGTGWEGFTSFNRSRSACHDLRDLVYRDPMAPLLESVHWSLNDLFLFNSWYFLDKETYSSAHFKTLLEGTPRSFGGKTGGVSSFGEMFSFPVVRETLLCSLLLLLLCHRRSFIPIFTDTAWVLFLLTLLMYFFKAPERLFLPAFFFILNLCLYHALPGQGGALPRQGGWNGFFRDKRVVWLAVSIVIGALILRERRSMDGFFKDRDSVLRTSLASLEPQDHQLFVTWFFPYESWRAFDDLEAFRQFHLFAMGPFQRSPIAERTLERFHVQNLFRDMVDNPDIFLICPPTQGALYREYMMEKYRMGIYVEKTFECPLFKVFRIHSKPWVKKEK